MTSWVFPAASAAISAGFATLVMMRAVKGHKKHLFLWALGLYGFTAAAMAQVVADMNGGWPEGVYRAYYFLIGSLVATMGAGTVYLMNKPKVADLFLYAMIGLIGAQAAVCAITPIDTARLAAAGTETGVGIASVPMRILTIILSSVGDGALILGALLSWWKSKRTFNLVIAAGGIVLALGGGTAGVASSETFAAYALYIGNLAGIALLFAGFLLSRPVGEATSRPAPGAEAAPPS